MQLDANLEASNNSLCSTTCPSKTEKMFHMLVCKHIRPHCFLQLPYISRNKRKRKVNILLSFISAAGMTAPKSEFCWRWNEDSTCQTD
jgi:hypothetical protein